MADTSGNTNSYTRGGVNSNDGQVAYSHGNINTQDSQIAYLHGGINSNDNLAAFVSGLDSSLDNQAVYLIGKDTDEDSQEAYAYGGLNSSTSGEAYLCGSLIPSVLSVTLSSFDSYETIHSISMPASVNVGDLLLCLIVNDGSAAVVTPDGWSGLATTAYSSYVRFGIYAKVAAGTEGGTTVDFETEGYKAGAAQVYRIGDWYGSLDGIEVSEAATGYDYSPNPPSLTASLGAHRNLWIACYGGDDRDASDGYPTDYTDFIWNAPPYISYPACCGSARRHLTSNVQDPSTFHRSDDEQWVAFTIVVYPAFSEDNSSTAAYAFGVQVENSTVHAFLSTGKSTCSSTEAYLVGSSSTNNSISAYTYSEAYPTPGSKAAYIRGGQLGNSSISSWVFGCIHDTTIAFLSGNIAANDNQAACIIGITENVSTYRHAYCYGVLRTSQSAYLGGVLMTQVDYIWLKTSDLSIEKKFRVITQDYDDGTLDRSEEINKTVGGGIDHSVGAIYKTWSMIIRVRHTETEENYGDRQDLEDFYSLNNPSGTPSNDITFIDHHQVEYTVHIVGKMTKNLLGCEIEGEYAWYLYKLNLMRIQ